MIEMTLPTMTCGHCVKVVTGTVQKVDAQARLQIDLPSHTVKIEKLSYTEKPVKGPVPDGFPTETRVEVSHLPEKYRSPQTSGLTAEVTAKGPNEFTFVLE